MGRFFIYCRIQLKFYPRVCLKRWNDRGEFELNRAKSKNNIAENSFALGHITHNRLASTKSLYAEARCHYRARLFLIMSDAITMPSLYHHSHWKQKRWYLHKMSNKIAYKICLQKWSCCIIIYDKNNKMCLLFMCHLYVFQIRHELMYS